MCDAKIGAGAQRTFEGFKLQGFGYMSLGTAHPAAKKTHQSYTEAKVL